MQRSTSIEDLGLVLGAEPPPSEGEKPPCIKFRDEHHPKIPAAGGPEEPASPPPATNTSSNVQNANPQSLGRGDPR